MGETDARLVEQLGLGQVDAFDQLFLRHYNQVYRVLRGVVGSHEAAEDVVQETFLALLREPPRLAAEDSVLPWLCRVAVNRGYNLLRGEQRQRQRMEQVGRLETPPSFNPDEALIRDQERGDVRAALATLPERSAKLLLLRHAGLSYAEIAEALELAASSVGTLLARAEKAFVAAYERNQPSEVSA